MAMVSWAPHTAVTPLQTWAADLAELFSRTPALTGEPEELVFKVTVFYLYSLNLFPHQSFCMLCYLQLNELSL